MTPRLLGNCLTLLTSDNTRLNKWRIERGALIFPDWSKGELILGGKDDVRKELKNEIYELIVSLNYMHPLFNSLIDEFFI